MTFFSYMVLEQGALSGKYDVNHPFPEGSARAESYNDKLPELSKLVSEMREIGSKHDASIAKGTVLIIGVTKVRHVEDAANAAQIQLNDKEIKVLERLAEKTEVSTIREWEKEMD